MLKHLDPDLWHVTLIAPENYFLFHPLLRESLSIFLLQRRADANFPNISGSLGDRGNCRGSVSR